MPDTIDGLNIKSGRTYWFLLPTEELANEISNHPEIVAEFENSNETVNFHWDPTLLSIKPNDLGFFCTPKEQVPEWDSFSLEDHWRNPQIFFTNEIQLRKFLPPNGNGAIEWIRNVINLQRLRHPM